MGSCWYSGGEVTPRAKTLSRLAVIQLRQWDHLVVRDGVLYHRVFHLDGGKEVLQVSLAAAIESQVLTQLHQQHGHQGVERTTQLVCQQCYWSGISSDIAYWWNREWGMLLSGFIVYGFFFFYFIGGETCSSNAVETAMQVLHISLVYLL